MNSLDRLHDLVLPPPAPWWPPAPGWIMVMIVALLLILVRILRRFLKWQSNRYRREALAIINDPETSVAELSGLTKRVALSVWPREEVAALNGRAWLAFLDHSCGMNLFSTGPGRFLEEAAYDDSSPEIDPACLRAAVREWIIRHQKEEAG